MKKLVVLIAGFSPLLIGYGVNLMLYNFVIAKLGMTLDFISIIFFLYWIILGVVLNKFTKSKISTPFLCNLPALIILILILFQELINKQYWYNNWGLATQYFYLPTLRVGFKLTPNFMYYMWQTYIVSFVLLVLSFCIGYYMKVVMKFCKNLINVR